MIDEIEIRESLPTEVFSIEKLYPAAFPGEDLLPLVRELLREKSIVLSLVGIADRKIAGHVVFTLCSIVGAAEKVALLGPLAVAPERQRRGIGSTLVREGFKRLKSSGATQVHVLGDPAYYGRFGFKADDGVIPPYALPEDWRGAWQSIRLRADEPLLHGELSLPRMWLRPTLWAP